MDGLTKNCMRHEETASRTSSSAGSITSEKLKMLDITRDKPIKVAVRVAVPVRDHPKFNFVGKLLGPKGNSMKRLQEDTMCKMAVLGRGSMKDRKKEEELRNSGDPRYSHLAEDLHVEISTFAAPAEAHARIAYALAEVRRFLVPDYHDDIRQEQMWEMQAISSSSSQTQTGEQNSPNSFTDDEGVQDHMSLNLSNLSAIPASTGPTSNESHSNFNNPIHVDLTGHHHTVHPSAVAAAIHQQLAAGAAGLIKPPNGISAVTGISSSQALLGMPSDAETTALALLETPTTLLHPALRGVKAVNIAGGLGRKRPLLGVPRSNMNPTKRTVMTLLARAKNAQAIQTVRNSNPPVISDNFNRHLQMITSPLILPQPMDETLVAAQKENIAQTV